MYKQAFSSIVAFALLIFPNICLAQADTLQHVIADRHNSLAQQQKPYVILISSDGFRADYAEKYHAENLLRFGRSGAMASYMKASFPSLTFPNHLSIVTGLYPSHHGIVDNMFYDRKLNEVYNMSYRKKVADGKWYGGVPLWVLAERQKMISASFYWVGSEAPIGGVFPTYYYTYSDKILFERRVAAVRQWLTLPEEKRPHLITFYFPDVDHAGHVYGPDAAQTSDAVQLIDRSVSRLVAMTDSLHLPVNFIFVSDHGMARTDTTRTIPVPSVIKDTSLCRWTWAANVINVYVKKASNIEKVYQTIQKDAKDFRVYRLEETPAEWHYRRADDTFNRMGDIVLVSAPPRYFKIGKGRQDLGKHGYDPSLPEMRATFMAWGPQIKSSVKLQPIANVDVYWLVAGLLNLEVDPSSIDGTTSLLSILKK